MCYLSGRRSSGDEGVTWRQAATGLGNAFKIQSSEFRIYGTQPSAVEKPAHATLRTSGGYTRKLTEPTLETHPERCFFPEL